jgi:DNA-directed RNA polymerase subunit RPC12/RpoP
MGVHQEIMEYLDNIDEIHTADNSYVCSLCGHRILWAEDDNQLHLLKQLQTLGFNVVTCGNCGDVVITKITNQV